MLRGRGKIQHLREGGVLRGKCSFRDFSRIVLASPLLWIPDFSTQVSRETLFLLPPFLLLLPVKQSARGCEQHMRTAQCLGLSAWTSLFSFIPVPGSHAACFLQRFVAFAHSFYTAPGRDLAGWGREDGGGWRGGRNGEGGKKRRGLEERGSLPLIYYEFSWETASRLESEW